MRFILTYTLDRVERVHIIESVSERGAKAKAFRLIQQDEYYQNLVNPFWTHQFETWREEIYEMSWNRAIPGNKMRTDARLVKVSDSYEKAETVETETVEIDKAALKAALEDGWRVAGVELIAGELQIHCSADKLPEQFQKKTEVSEQVTEALQEDTPKVSVDLDELAYLAERRNEYAKKAARLTPRTSYVTSSHHGSYLDARNRKRHYSNEIGRLVSPYLLSERQKSKPTSWNAIAKELKVSTNVLSEVRESGAWHTCVESYLMSNPEADATKVARQFGIEKSEAEDLLRQIVETETVETETVAEPYTIKEEADSAGDAIWKVYRGEEMRGFFRSREEAEAYRKAQESGVETMAHRLHALNSTYSRRA